MPEPITMSLQCPLCEQAHKYPVVVERSVTSGLLTRKRRPTEVTRTFERTFICPTTTNRFQATLQLKETAASRINDLTVRAPVDGTDG